MGSGWWGRSRGVSSVVGSTLLIGLVLAGAVTVVLVGATAITDLQNAAQTNRAETAMTQLDARAAQVALGGSDAQRIGLGGGGSGRIHVDDGAGHIEIAKVNDTGRHTLADETLGAVVYEVGDTSIAYQGGGVWWRQENDSTMVSPPEYHYREQTLTFPIIRVTGESWSGSATGPIVVAENGSDQLYPNETTSNPLQNGHVNVRITSDYHRGWKEFLNTRTEGNISHDPATRTVEVNLTVPVTETFDNTVTATSDASDAIDESSTSHHGGFEPPTESGVDRPSPSDRIDAKIADCTGGGCTSLSTGLADDTLENDTYFAAGDTTIGETTYDTSGGDIQVVVDGDLEFAGSGGPPGTAHHEITGGGTVTFYVKGDVTVSGNTGVNTGGDASDLLVMVHSDAGSVTTASGTPQFTGAIYAPNASLTINGGGSPSNDNIVGSVVVNDATAHGNGNIAFEDCGFELQFDPVIDITFLHVTENRVDVGPDP